MKKVAVGLRKNNTEGGHKKGMKGNDLALKHGLYSSLSDLDRRTKAAREIERIRGSLVSDKGGDPTTGEALIIERASYKAWRLRQLETLMMQANGDAPERWAKDYLRWSRELRSDLLALGLECRERDITDLARAFAEEDMP